MPRLGLRKLGSYLVQPVLQVVVVRDSAHFPFIDLEKGSDSQVVGLASGGGQAFVRLQIASANIKFRRAAASILTGENHQILYLLRVTAIHALEKFTKGRNSHFGTALINVMRHLICEQRKEGFAIACIESGVVAAEEFDGRIFCGHLLTN